MARFASMCVETAVGARAEATIEVVDEEVGRIVLDGNRVVVRVVAMIDAPPLCPYIPSPDPQAASPCCPWTPISLS